MSFCLVGMHQALSSLCCLAYQRNLPERQSVQSVYPFGSMPPVYEVIRGQANHVMRCLGTGHTESVYHRALITAMNRAGVGHRSEVACPFVYMGECVGMGKADLVIDDVIVEIKANKLPPKETSPQLQKYVVSLSRAEKRNFKGMVLNFNQKSGSVDIYHDAKLSEVFERSKKNVWQENGVPELFKRKALKALEGEIQRFKRARK